MAKLPDFQRLWDAYPADEDPAAVKAKIGGAVDADWIVNTCTIRLSRSFNYAGKEWRIPATFAFATQYEPKKLTTIKGGDGLRYAFRVAEMLKYLKARFGQPKIRVLKQRGDGMPAQFAGRKGILVFNDCGWSDATGHVDLWNGEAAAHHAYWSEAKEVYLWALDGRWAVAGASHSSGTPIVTVR